MIEFLQSIITIVLFLAILGILVIIHELGHFVTARLANVRVLEFGVGFPPRARVLRDRGETLYTLNWLPIGGFVKLEGEDGDGVDDARSFAAQRCDHQDGHPRRRCRDERDPVAFAIFTASRGWPRRTSGLRFYEVQPDSPAAAAGLVPGRRHRGDRRRALPVHRRARASSMSLRARAGETIDLTIDGEDGARRQVTVTLRDPAVAAEQGALGISRQDRDMGGLLRRRHDDQRPA